MTTHPCDPCTGGKTALSKKTAQNVASAIVHGVKPGPDPADGTYVRARTPIGHGIRHILFNIGC
jgi:hypothetical protein